MSFLTGHLRSLSLFMDHRLRTTSNYEAALPLYSTGVPLGGEVSSPAAAQGGLHMKSAPSPLTAGLMPTAFLLQGPGSHDAFVWLFHCFFRIWWSCLFAGEDKQLLWTPYLLSHRDGEKAWAQTHGQGKEERQWMHRSEQSYKSKTSQKGKDKTFHVQFSTRQLSLSSS